ncbi:MAG TPA: biotin/lipoyl-containing protein [Saprospiraceae bacterium]|nr:biotin/lipoyl-containing protein [Saprospiraceae bacterium]
MKKSSSMVVEIEGKRFDLDSADWQNLDCIRIDTDTFHLLENGLAHTISIIASDPASRRYTLKIDGEIKEVTLIDNLDLLIEKMGLNSTKTKKLSVLKAPMPGLVTGIKIAEGDEVEKGTPLIILEAMKMENMISAPHHAIIKSVHVSVGQAVEKGSVLVEFAV